MKTSLERFYEKVDWSACAAGSSCWEWTGGKTIDGYALFWFEGKGIKAHRFIMGFPKQINHRCHNKGCVNPSHLYSGNQKQNFIDMKKNGDWVPPPIHYGHRHSAKLTEEQVREIKNFLQNEYKPRCRSCSQGFLAKKYKVSRGLISAIAKGKHWQEV